MTFVDSILLLIVLAALVIGWRKGFVRQSASLVSWALGIAICFFFSDRITELFILLNPSTADWPVPSITVKTVAVSFAFLIVTLAVRVVAFVLRKLIKSVHLGVFDRAGGSLLFMFKWLMVVSILLNLLFACNPDADTFRTRHALANKPFEFTLDLMPHVLGVDTMPSDSLPIYRFQADSLITDNEKPR